MVTTEYIIQQVYSSAPSGIPNELENTTGIVRTVELKSTFNPDADYLSLEVRDSETEELISSTPKLTTYSLTGYQLKDREGVYSRVILDPDRDLENLNQPIQNVTLNYTHYNHLDFELDDLIVDKVSEDGTEITLISVKKPEAVKGIVNTYKVRTSSKITSSTIKLIQDDNTTATVVNMQVYEKGIAVKLQKPFSNPVTQYKRIRIVEILSNPIVFAVTTNIQVVQDAPKMLQRPNFNVEEPQSRTTTEYLTVEDILEGEENILSHIDTISISADYTVPATFIKYSSGVRRLLNFEQKIQELEDLQSTVGSIQSITSGSVYSSQSLEVLQNKVKGILSTFDQYEQYLYFDSGSGSWPKSNTSKPYQLYARNSPIVQTWLTGSIDVLEIYDNGNTSRLINTVPNYLTEHSTSVEFLKFVDMIGQHYDSIWEYSVAVSQRFNTDNRLEVGTPKELVAEVLKGFGYEVTPGLTGYGSSLGSNYITGSYLIGTEVINSQITGSNYVDSGSLSPLSLDSYVKEVYKRIYHNIPTLLKSRGTVRHLEVLYNCFGVPEDLLKPIVTVGTLRSKLPYTTPTSAVPYRDYSITTGSVRLTGDTLSELVSIEHTVDTAANSVKYVQIGISPSDDTNRYIESNISSSFNIDEYIGNELTTRTTGYQDLSSIRKKLLDAVTRLDLKDYTRILRFWNSEMFRFAVKHLSVDEIPLTGFVVKSDSLKYSPQEPVTGKIEELTKTTELNLVDVEGGTALGDIRSVSTSYVELKQTPTGFAASKQNNQEEALYTGVFKSGSTEAVNRELTRSNIWARESTDLEGFKRGDYNVTYGNVQINRPSKLKTTENQSSDYQDSNDSLETWNLGRYKGSKTDEDRFGNIEPSAGGIVFEAYAYPQNNYTGNPEETLKTVKAIKAANIPDRDWQTYILTNTGVLDFENLTGKQSAQTRSNIQAPNYPDWTDNLNIDLTSYLSSLQDLVDPYWLWQPSVPYQGTVFTVSSLEVFAVIPGSQGLPKSRGMFNRSRRWKLQDDQGRYETVTLLQVDQDFQNGNGVFSEKGYLSYIKTKPSPPSLPPIPEIWNFEFYKLTLQRPVTKVITSSNNLVRLESIDSRVYSLESSKLKVPARTYLKIRNTNQVVEVDEYGTAQLLPEV